MKLLVKNIKELIAVDTDSKLKLSGAEMKELNTIQNAYLITDGEWIASFGLMENLDKDPQNKDFIKTIDATGKMLFPAFVDSHTHLVYAGSREVEYRDKIMGLSYEEIARRGGGILNSAKLLHNTLEDALYEQALVRIRDIIRMGTGAVEIKSGYGLTVEDELKMLRVIKRLKENTPIEIKATFLGAHAVPAEYKGRQGAYVDLVINEMLPKVAEEKLADFVDVFCKKGFFTVDETDRILAAAANYGLRPKIQIGRAHV